jgi:glutamate--cysteine ligase
MSQYVAGSDAEVTIERYDQLVSYFESACKPPAQWRIGTEYEKVAVHPKTGVAAPFTGGIEELLRRMADRYPWTPIIEGGRVVALGGPHASITLEPGGQLELSGEICDSVHCAKREFDEHVEQILAAAEGLDMVFLGIAMQPVSKLPDIEWVPKQRYGIMGPYMRQVGTLGHRMMLQTATVQVNIDYGDESDAMHKLRTGMGLSSILTAMYANSPISDGAANGFLSHRAHIWTKTDPDRCGLLPFVFAEMAGFTDYVDYALDVPMYFIVRDGNWIDMTKYTFRRFWQEGRDGHRATIDDWNAHLTTLFPEFRMKGYIEVRSCDSQAPELMLSVPALVKGVFYDRDCLDAAWDLVKKWNWAERQELHHQVPREALRSRARGHSLRDLAQELLAIARVGLGRNPRLDANGRDESIYLHDLEELVGRGLCPADVVLSRWNGEWRQDMRRLVAASAYPARS